MTEIKTTAAYVIRVSRDTNAKPGLQWRYEATRDGMPISSQAAFGSAREAERFAISVARESAEAYGTAFSLTIHTKGH